MKIGVISTIFPTRRTPTAGIFVREELDNLADAVDFRLIAPFPNQHWLRSITTSTPAAAYPVKRPFTLAFPRFFKQHLYPASLAATLRLHCKEFFRNCDAVHAHNAFPEGVAAVKAFVGIKPVIVTVHGSDVNYFAMKPNLQPDIVAALNKAAVIICVSGSLAKTLDSIGVTTRKVVIPNGIDTGFLLPGDKSQACKATGLDPDKKRILFAGNFVGVKGVEYLIRAFPEVLSSYPDCELVLLGAPSQGGGRHRYDDEIAKAGVRDSVVIKTSVPHKQFPDWLNACDLLVLPSVNEGFGLVAAEALACGKPVVSTLSGGPEDIVGDGMGYLVPPKNVEELASAIIRTFGGDGILDAESLAESARNRFSYNKVAEKILGVYRSVI